MGTLAEDAGLDITICEFCEKKVKTGQRAVQGLDGMWAHEACLKRMGLR